MTNARMAAKEINDKVSILLDDIATILEFYDIRSPDVKLLLKDVLDVNVPTAANVEKTILANSYTEV